MLYWLGQPGTPTLPLLFPSGGIQWYSIQGCTETQDECFKRITKPSGILSTHCCLYSLCNLWASGPFPSCLTDQLPQSLIWSSQDNRLPLIHPLQNTYLCRSYALWSKTSSGFQGAPLLPHHLQLLPETSFFNTMSLLSSFCSVPFLVTSKLQRSKNVFPWGK